MTEQVFLAQIDAALSAGDMARAGEIAQAALLAGHRSATLLNIAAWQLEEAGDLTGAWDLLDEALRLDPDDPLLHISIGAVLRKEGRLAEAIAKLTSIIDLAGDNPALWMERAYAFDFNGMLKEAQTDYEQSLRLDPSSAPGWAGLASVAARLGDRETARAAGKRALSIDSGNATAHIALARCDLESDAASSARDRLATLTQRADVHPADQLIALGLLGDAHQKLDECDAVFAAYRAAKEVFRTLHAPSFAGQVSQQAFIESLSDQLAALSPKLWAPVMTSAAPARGHVFLLGYPRSGTTLVETILASAPDVETLEERPTLRDADLAFLEAPDGLARLAHLSAEEVSDFRALYWERVRSFGIDPIGKTFVDMDPLKGIKLPIIAKLFPDARVVVMRRDPRDVVWSCFHTNFAPSAAAFAFTNLEGTARHYDALMRLTEQCLQSLPINAHEVRYDALVGDFDATTRALCDFIGINWSEELRAFDKTAQMRNIQTASAGQVRQGLYDGGGQWTRYAAHLAAVEQILQPWVDKFGTKQSV
jgi:Flp pilus assembly protein TadD